VAADGNLSRERPEKQLSKTIGGAIMLSNRDKALPTDFFFVFACIV
jgi:hypothetical protein